MNEPDTFALEEALRLKEKHGGKVVALSLGPERVKQTIQEALAKGADRGIHIADDHFAQLDPLGTAKVLAAAIAKEKYDLVLTGLQSDDHGFGQTGVLLAGLLNLPHATIIMQIDVQDGKMKLKRELEAGWFQRIECPLPAVLSIQSGINKVRYATMKGIIAAKKKQIANGRERVAGRDSRTDAENRKDLRADENQENRILDRDPEGNGGEAGAKAEGRKAGDLIMKILVIAEQRQGKWNNTSFETLVAAQQIAAATSGTVSAAVIGKGVAALAEELATKDVAEVLLVEHELLESYTPDGYCTALKQVIEAAKPDLVLFPHTYQVRDFAPALAAMLGKGMVGDCIGFRNEGGKLVFVRQMFQGKTVADVTFTGAAPWFASFQSGAFRADLLAAHPSGKAPVNACEGGVEGGRHSHEAAGNVQGGEVGGGPDAGAGDCGDRPRHQGAGEDCAGRSAGEGDGRRDRGDEADLR